MNYELLSALLFAIPIIATMVQLCLVNSDYQSLASISQLLFCAALVVLSICLFSSNQTIIIDVASWPAPYGISLVIDGLTKLMLLVFSIAITCINLYSLQEKSQQKNQRYFYLGGWILTLGCIGALATYDVFNLYVWSELMLVSAFVLLNVQHKENVIDVYHYALINIIGTLIMLTAIAMLYRITGNLNYAAIRNTLPDTPYALPTLLLFFFGLAIKGGIFPFYFWLPKAYPNTSASATMILTSLVTKVILVVILRLVWLWPPLHSSQAITLFILLACCTMFFGVMGAATEYNIRRILSFHIISQLGYILLVVFIPLDLAIIAMLYFLIHNIFVKTSLLMTCGIIEQRYQTTDLSALGHIINACPLLALLFFVSAMSLAGIPPLSGFWGKLFIIKATVDSKHYLASFFVIAVSLFTLYSMIKIWRFGYCQAEKEGLASQRKFSLTNIEIAALLPLIIMPLIMGVYPKIITPSLMKIANQLHPTQLIKAGR